MLGSAVMQRAADRELPIMAEDPIGHGMLSMLSQDLHDCASAVYIDSFG